MCEQCMIRTSSDDYAYVYSARVHMCQSMLYGQPTVSMLCAMSQYVHHEEEDEMINSYG